MNLFDYNLGHWVVGVCCSSMTPTWVNGNVLLYNDEKDPLNFFDAEPMSQGFLKDRNLMH